MTHLNREVIRATTFFIACCISAQVVIGVEITVSAGKHSRTNAPVRVTFEVPEAHSAAKAVTLIGEQGSKLAGQLTSPSLLSATNKPATRELHFVLPALQSNQTAKFQVQFGGEPASGPSFAWDNQEGKHAELRFGERPVLRYMYEAIDNSTPERRGETFKVYHHVYDPRGKRLVTKGAGGLFPHHRGLFYGFNKITYEDGGMQRAADVWHCNKGEWQSHEGFLAAESGPILGRHRLLIAWHGQDGKVFAKEQRELTAFNSPEGILIEFASRLETSLAAVRLDGDPQHAGFQFRASQDVPDKTKDQTYYVRPDGQDKPGSFRNWPQNKDHVNLPWNSLCFVLDGKRFTCCYLDRPQNPKESRFSERDYGRFGSYFEYDLLPHKPLEVDYRVWLKEGEMTVGGVQRLSDDFVSPVTAQVN